MYGWELLSKFFYNYLGDAVTFFLVSFCVAVAASLYYSIMSLWARRKLPIEEREELKNASYEMFKMIGMLYFISQILCAGVLTIFFAISVISSFWDIWDFL